MLVTDHYKCKSNVVLDFTLFIRVTSKESTASAASLGNCLETADS